MYTCWILSCIILYARFQRKRVVVFNYYNTVRDKKKKKIPYYNIHNIVHVYITRLLHRLLCCVMDARVIQVYGTRDYNIINYIPIYIYINYK